MVSNSTTKILSEGIQSVEELKIPKNSPGGKNCIEPWRVGGGGGRRRRRG